MKIIAISALLASAQSIGLRLLPEGSLIDMQPESIQLLQTNEPCETLEMSAAQLAIELDYFSRKCDRTHYDNAMKIYGELSKAGSPPQLKINTWELYDKSFSFDRIRRFELVQHHMDLLQHFEDNLNQNFSNGQAVANFIDVCKKASTELNAKYHDGEFSDPAKTDPQEDAPVTWATAKV